MRPILALVLLLSLAAPVAAQDDCDQASLPCAWIVDVDATTFTSSLVNFTEGEWYELTVSNLDETAHTVTLSGYGTSITAPADNESSVVIQFTQTGDFVLRDETTGKSVTIHVVEADSVDYGAGSVDASGNPITTKAPAMALPLLALALAALAFIVRRAA